MAACALDEEDDPFPTAWVRLALCTGMRRGALLGIRWEDLDFERGLIILQGTIAKKKRSGTILMNARAMTIL